MLIPTVAEHRMVIFLDADSLNVDGQIEFTHPNRVRTDQHFLQIWSALREYLVSPLGSSLLDEINSEAVSRHAHRVS